MAIVPGTCLLQDYVSLATRFTRYIVNGVRRDNKSRAYFLIVYITTPRSSLNTTTFCFFHVCPVPHLTDYIGSDPFYNHCLFPR